jgi:hypothetical protein
MRLLADHLDLQLGWVNPGNNPGLSGGVGCRRHSFNVDRRHGKTLVDRAASDDVPIVNSDIYRCGDY